MSTSEQTPITQEIIPPWPDVLPPIAAPVAEKDTYTVLTRNLSRSYGEFEAVSDVSMSIEPGAIFGFIGPNGAGKTTTMRMLGTLLEPTAGEAWVCGYSINDQRIENLQAIRACIGYMPDFIGSYEKMTAREYLEFFAAAYKVEAKRRATLVNDLLQLVDLSSKRDTYIEGLSRGMTQRLALARTLVHDPKLLILDEPASGLDPRARIELRELIRELSRMGKTILISSHILTELAEMCTHIGIIERGQLLASGRVQDILRSINQHLRIVRLKIGHLSETELARVPAFLAGGPKVKAARPLEIAGEWELQVEGEEADLNKLLRYFVQYNLPVYSFSEQVTNLENIFMQVTQGYVN